MSSPFAYVLLDENIMPDMAALEEALRARHPGVEIKAGQGYVRCNGDTILVMPIPVPVADYEWEQPGRRAQWAWPEAEAVFKRHATHLQVTSLGETSDKVHLGRSITAVVGGLIATLPGCLGVLWSNVVAQPAELWLDVSRHSFASSPDAYSLWFSIIPFEEGAVVVAITFGLERFVGREIELELRNAGAEELIMGVAGLAVYLLDHGPIVGDGQTFGLEGGASLKVRHVTSRRVEGLPVLYATRLDA